MLNFSLRIVKFQTNPVRSCYLCLTKISSKLHYSTTFGALEHQDDRQSDVIISDILNPDRLQIILHVIGTR